MNNISAFPSVSESTYNKGMTLRDYFAIKAFQVRLAKYNDWTLTELTEQAYLDADAMLEARN
jgi:hypothetical protein